jgi:hypothetical protein
MSLILKTVFEELKTETPDMGSFVLESRIVIC